MTGLPLLILCLHSENVIDASLQFMPYAPCCGLHNNYYNCVGKVLGKDAPVQNNHASASTYARVYKYVYMLLS